MRFNVISVMPELIEQALQFGVVGSAFKKGMCELNLVNPRSFTTDTHQTVDDRPFGGGDGMLMMAGPLEQALKSCPAGEVFYLSPQGSSFTDSLATHLAQEKSLTLICGRYGGVDQRFLTKNKIKEISIGDYVLSGGELGALVMIDGITRKIPGVLGHPASAYEDSFSSDLLEAPHFTRPQSWQGYDVPAILLSGDHKKIAHYKEVMSVLVTLLKRPDLLETQKLQWTEIYDAVLTMDETDLTFLPENRKNILEKIKERIDA